ncbi:MAG: hypothetical protein CML47_06830 [Rhodobacteraceae bacterium]|nr:MAG: hypothetical protein CML47_06830 [Paracoccaceae bacterium]|tara:strand:- start:8714 stop:10048 length:1335 start_codon:yes stop_codon:yes gene_type:complete
MSESYISVCSICHENINLSDEKVQCVIDASGGCGNYFHRNCIKEWCNMSNSKTCPICRRINICDRMRLSDKDEVLLDIINNFSDSRNNILHSQVLFPEIIREFLMPMNLQRLKRIRDIGLEQIILNKRNDLLQKIRQNMQKISNTWGIEVWPASRRGGDWPILETMTLQGLKKFLTIYLNKKTELEDIEANHKLKIEELASEARQDFLRRTWDSPQRRQQVREMRERWNMADEDDVLEENVVVDGPLRRRLSWTPRWRMSSSNPFSASSRIRIGQNMDPEGTAARFNTSIARRAENAAERERLVQEVQETLKNNLIREISLEIIRQTIMRHEINWRRSGREMYAEMQTAEIRVVILAAINFPLFPGLSLETAASGGTQEFIEWYTNEYNEEPPSHIIEVARILNREMDVRNASPEAQVLLYNALQERGHIRRGGGKAEWKKRLA